jgi:YidC/Oxa1 family membrane protein insertase
MHSQRKMLALAPQMQELRKRYKNDKQKLNEEMMKLYKENGANPLSGCLPLIAQLPVWFALLNVLRALTEKKALYDLTPTVVHEALSAHILGVTVASKFLFQASSVHTKIVIGITVVLSAATTYLTVRQSMKRGMMQTPTVDENNPMAGAQKYMAYIAPLFALSGLYWQYGLVIYWLASNLWTLGQQYFLFKKIPPLNLAAANGAAGTSGATGTAPPVRTKTVTAPPAKRTAPATKQVTQGTRQATQATRQQPGSAKQAAGRVSGQESAAAPAKGSGPPARPSPPAKAPASGKKAAAAKTDPASLGIPPPTPNGSGGRLRKLVGKRAEPEPEPEVPEVTIVRQQRVKQSRSKRTGKR